MSDVIKNAEDVATAAFQRILSKHSPARTVVIACVISDTEMAIWRAGLSPEECSTVITELQSMLDSWRAFTSKN